MHDLSRRRFIQLVGHAGGAAAAYSTMAAMGLLPTPAAYAGPPPLPAGSGRGVRVVVLGAGIAGMVAAYELRKAGYTCSVLEARARPGGRCWTLRGGDVIDESDSTQRLTWDAGDHMYCNAGPARLPHHHEGMLAYCRELEVPLEVMVNDAGALLQDDEVNGGKPMPARALAEGGRGVVAELAARAVDKGALAAPFTAADGESLRDFLRHFGGLDRKLGRRGSAVDVRALLRPGFWRGPLVPDDGLDHAPTMLQPVGGMARIAQAFARALGPIITFNAEVTHLEHTRGGARVTWKDRRGGAAQTVEAPYVVCTLPLPLLRRIDAALAPTVRTAARVGGYLPAVRVAFQADRRFWELDDQIHGGISWTTRDITQIWYPSHGVHQKKGVLMGAYIWTSSIGEAFERRPPGERLALAIASGERLHPGYGRQVSRGASVAWGKIPFSEGAWASLPHDVRDRLRKPDGAVHFAGEHLSDLPGWQEGALLSAHAVVADIGERVRAKKL
jgi:monoamine oxidase